MYNHQHAFSTHYASISPNAELKVHVFLNVAHQRGCKVVNSGYSMIWILRTAPSGSRLSGTSTHVHHGRDNPTPPRCGVISAVLEKELGERNVGFDSLKSRDWTVTWRRKGRSPHVITPTLCCSDLSSYADESSRRSPHTTERSEQSVEYLSANSFNTIAEITSTVSLYLL